MLWSAGQALHAVVWGPGTACCGLWARRCVLWCGGQVLRGQLPSKHALLLCSVWKGMFSEGLMHGQGTYIWADGLKYEVSCSWEVLHGPNPLSSRREFSMQVGNGQEAGGCRAGCRAGPAGGAQVRTRAHQEGHGKMELQEKIWFRMFAFCFLIHTSFSCLYLFLQLRLWGSGMWVLYPAPCRAGAVAGDVCVF